MSTVLYMANKLNRIFFTFSLRLLFCYSFHLCENHKKKVFSHFSTLFSFSRNFFRHRAEVAEVAAAINSMNILMNSKNCCSYIECICISLTCIFYRYQYMHRYHLMLLLFKQTHSHTEHT